MHKTRQFRSTATRATVIAALGLTPLVRADYVNDVGRQRARIDVSAGSTYTPAAGLWISTLTGSGGTTLSGPLTVGSGALSRGSFNPAPENVESFTYSGVLSGSGGLTKSGPSNWTLSGDHTYIGGTRIDHGQLVLGGGGSTGSVLGTIVLGGTNNAYYADIFGAHRTSDYPFLVLNRSDTYTFSNPVLSSSGYGAIVNRAGHVTLTGTKQGDLAVEGGSMTLGANLGSTGLGLGFVLSGASLDIGQYTLASFLFTNQGTIHTGTGSALHLYRSSSTASTGTITGSGAVIKKELGSSANVVALGGASTYSGGTTVEGGTLRALSAQAFGTGTLLVTRVNPSFGTWQTSTLDLNGQAIANAIDYRAGAIRNASAHTGTLTIRTAADITGTIGGTVIMGSGGSLDLAGRTVKARFVNDPLGGTNGSIALANGRLEVGTASRTTRYSGTVTGPGTLVKTDTGLAESATPGDTWNNTLDLAGSRSYSGTTRVEGGTLIVRNFGAIGSSQIRMEQTAPAGGFAEGRSAQTVVVDFSQVTAAPVSNFIDYRSGILRGMENHSGSILLHTAAVFENSTRIGNGSGIITVFNGGTLPGHTYLKNITLTSGGGLLGGGSVQALTVQSGGYLDFTDSVATALTVQNSLTLGTGRSVSLDLNGLFHDSITVRGLFTAGGLLDVQLAPGAALEAGDVFNLITAQNYAGAFDEVRLPTLTAGLTWDASQLASTGALSISAIPEPSSTALLIALGSLGAACARRKRKPCK